MRTSSWLSVVLPGAVGCSASHAGVPASHDGGSVQDSAVAGPDSGEHEDTGTVHHQDSGTSHHDAAVTVDSGRDGSTQPSDAGKTLDVNVGDAGARPADALKGVYGLMVGMTYDASNSVIQTVMGNPDVDGVFIGFPWSVVAPTSSTTDFTKIDAWLQAAVTAGKRVSIGIEAGSATPSWVGSPSDYVTFTVYQFEQGTCQSNVQIPIPWHTSFLTAWQGLVQALSKHLAGEPTLFAAVSAIKITGINDSTFETSLPYEAAGTHGTCTTTDAASAWHAVGYTDALVESAWQTIIGYYDAAFPSTALCMQDIDEGFPAEYADGGFQPMNNAVTTAMIAAAKSTLGTGRFVAEGTGITAVGGTIPNLDTYATGGGVVGYQTLYYVYDNTTCTMNNHVLPCDATVLDNAIQLGIKHQMKYIELYQEDIGGFPAEVTIAHDALVP